MEKIIRVIQIKRGTKARLTEVLQGNKKPEDGEPIWELDTGKLKFGDGIHDYGSLEYFKTGDVEIEGSLDGQILIYNASTEKWEPKPLADTRSIEYSSEGLQIAGFNTSGQGNIPVSNAGNIVWQKAITVEDAEQAVNNARQAAAEALAQALIAKNYAEAAGYHEQQTANIRDMTMEFFNKKFWYGSQAEYLDEIVNQNNLTEGTIYFIYDYNLDAYPNE